MSRLVPSPWSVASGTAFATLVGLYVWWRFGQEPMLLLLPVGMLLFGLAHSFIFYGDRIESRLREESA